MSYFNLMVPSLFIAMLTLVGCSDSNKSTLVATHSQDTTMANGETEHTHGSGPNGGVIFDLGSHHAEFTVDHRQQQGKILLLGDDQKTPTNVASSELILNIKETRTADGTVVPPITVFMTPTNTRDGKASEFVGTDPGISNVADFAGTVSGEIDGKPAMGVFEE